jgi:enoyl-CoA hydratase/carnithine racemase
MNLLVEKKHRVLHISLNRPEKRNALTSAMCQGIVEAIHSVQTDQSIGSILIGGVGQVFSSGMDLDEALSFTGTGMAVIHEKLFTIGAQSLKPIVVAVNGAALGGGLGLVAQGHVIVAEHSSVFGLPEIRIGLWPFLVYRALEAAVGARRMLALSLMGRTFPAADALAWGLIHQVCHDDEVCDRGWAIARDLAKACPGAIEAGMQYARDSREKTWEEAGKLAASLRDKLMASDDFKEGCAALKAHRDAQWPGMPPGSYPAQKKHNGQPTAPKS